MTQKFLKQEVNMEVSWVTELKLEWRNQKLILHIDFYFVLYIVYVFTCPAYIVDYLQYISKRRPINHMNLSNSIYTAFLLS